MTYKILMPYDINLQKNKLPHYQTKTILCDVIVQYHQSSCREIGLNILKEFRIACAHIHGLNHELQVLPR